MNSRLRTYCRRAAVVGLLAALPAKTGAAQSGTISGTVRAEGRVLAHARVEALVHDVVRAHTGTDDNGHYRLGVPAGQYTLLFRFQAYAQKRVDSVQVATGGPTTVDADLVLQPVGLDRVVVTAARRTESAAGVPATVSIVEESTVQEHSSLTPLDYMTATPGVDVAVQGLQGRQVVARGFNATISSSLLMLTDYRNASLPSPRANVAYFLSQTSDDLERIEVVNGPSSALYGPNAADGVVHFITKSPFDSPGTTMSVTGGGRNLFEGTGRYATLVSDRFAIKVSGSYFRGKEWLAPINPAEHFSRDSVTERAGGELRADFRVSPTATAILTLGTADALHVPEYTPIGAYAIRHWRTDFAQLRFNDGNFFAQTYWNGNPGGGTSTSLQSGVVTLDHTSIFAAQVQHGVDLGARSSLSYGVDLQRTDPQSLGTIDGRNEQDDITLEVGAYARSTTAITSKLQLEAAARLDKHDRLNSPVFSPRVGLAYTPSQGHTFRLSYNRAFSTPAPLQLFADILAAHLDPLPFDLRAVGVPKDGIQFGRTCGGGLCVSSPFAPGKQLPLDATQLWPAVVQIMKGAGVDLSGIPAPTAADVGTVLRVLDLASGSFRSFAGPVNDFPALSPTITNSLEAGYHGLVGERLLFDIAGYTTRRQNFIAPLSVMTPNAFLSTPALATYLGKYMPAAQAAALAAGIGGVDGNAAAPGIPLATVGPTGRLSGSDILLSYRNVGDVRLWGTDVSAEFVASDRVTLSGSYSWVNRNFFAAARPGDIDLSTNTPRNKALAGARFHDAADDLWADLRGRYAGAFRMVDGVLVGDVKSFAVIDAEVGMVIPGAAAARLTVTAQNLTDQRHQEFYGHPIIGRLLLTRLQYRF